MNATRVHDVRGVGAPNVGDGGLSGPNIGGALGHVEAVSGLGVHRDRGDGRGHAREAKSERVHICCTRRRDEGWDGQGSQVGPILRNEFNIRFQRGVTIGISFLPILFFSKCRGWGVVVDYN